MKKAFFLVTTAILTLVACGKNDNNPTPNNPQNTDVKRIKEVKITYLDRMRSSNPSGEYVPDYQYTLKNSAILYEYDSQGRISKMTLKKEDSKDEEVSFEYPQGKIIAKIGQQQHEEVLNDKGYYKGFSNDFVYNAQGQLITSRRGDFSWDNNGNITQLLRIREGLNGETETITTTMTYYPNENKNKWLLFNDENGDVIGKYTTFFEREIILPIGVPTKNLIKSMKKEFDDIEYGYTSSNTTAFNYNCDNDGYVTRIVENRFGVEHINSSPENSSSEQAVKDLENKITKIQNGTLKDLSYKIISNENGLYKVVITYKKHITQDTKGKTIDVKYEEETYYEFSYKEENGKRTYLKMKSFSFTKQDASNIYEISYY